MPQKSTVPRRRPQRRVLRHETVRRREVQAAAERAMVIAAATELFSVRGYHETSIRDIATHAGFSVGALYERFESKDALYCDVVEKHFGNIWGELDRAAAEHTAFAPRLHALTEAIFTHVSTNHTFLRVYELHPPTLAEPYQSKIAHYRSLERSRRALVDAFAQGCREGAIGRSDAEFLGTAYWGMLNRLVLDFLIGGRPLPEPEQVVELFLEGAARSGPRTRSVRASKRGRTLRQVR